MSGLMAKIARALISVSDKSGLVPLAQALVDSGVQIISTGGTAKALQAAGLEVTELSAHTGFPEMLDGRVKTLHPKVHGGLLYVRGNETHEAAVAEHDIASIDLVIVNLYPFEATVAKPDVTLEEAIENIDIGGPSMLRSAAKNHRSVTVIVDPDDYAIVADQVRANGETSLELRQKLAAKVYARTASYDKAISTFLAKAFDSESAGSEAETALPEKLVVDLPRVQTLRYGENPHQAAALYGSFNDYFSQLHGKALSYNNILDLTAAASLISEFDGFSPTLAILKHTNPCGVGQADSLREAWDKAFATDRQAPFGGIIVSNTVMDGPCAEAIREIFSEVIIAPDFAPEAMEILTKKKNLRLLKMHQFPNQASDLQFRAVGAGSVLVQEADTYLVPESDLKVVTERAPSVAELAAMKFGWRVVKHVKSNAIVYTGSDRTLGIGAGQMSRVDSSRIAVWKAGEVDLSLKGSVVCSDAFFPFADGLIAAAEAGATAAIQPGGSMRDQEVIDAANERGVAMVFTGNRHFRH
jgi:phosphoribosylaminoimidazolecarboxamide formyltransferase / IMP cyclohydrolase